MVMTSSHGRKFIRNKITLKKQKQTQPEMQHKYQRIPKKK